MHLPGLCLKGKMTTHEVPYRHWQQKQDRKSTNKKEASHILPQILHFLLIKRIRKLSYTYKKKIIGRPKVSGKELSMFSS